MCGKCLQKYLSSDSMVKYVNGIDHTRKRSKVEPLDGHISTTKKDNTILWRNSLPLLS